MASDSFGLNASFAHSKARADDASAEAVCVYEKALAETPLYALLKIEIHAPLAHRACWFCGAEPPRPSLGAAQRVEYLDCLATDIALAARALQGHGRIASIEFNAGAPFSMSADEVGAVLDAIEAELGLTDLTLLGVELGGGTGGAAKAAELIALGVSRFTLMVGQGALASAAYDLLEDSLGTLRSAGAADVGVAFCADLPSMSGQDATELLRRIVMLSPDRIVLHRNADRLERDPSLEGVAPPAAPLLPHQTAQMIYGAGYAEAAPRVFTRPELVLEKRVAEDARLATSTVGFGVGAFTRINGRRFRKARSFLHFCGLTEAGLPPVDVFSRRY